MGLNLETLIGILVILILLILADGVRRMIRERHGRLRMRIDRRFRGQDGTDDGKDDAPNDLVSRPRVRGRDTHANEQADEKANEQTGATEVDDSDPQEVAPRAEQQTLFDVEPPAPSGAMDMDDQPATDSAASTRAVREEEALSDRPVLDVIVFHLIARNPDRFDGKAMLSLMLESGLRYGEMNIFHRHQSNEGRDELQFSVANAVEPGTFDIDGMEEQEFAGITFFLKLPGPEEALDALDRMLAIGRRMANELEGDLKDEQHSVLTPQTMEHLRQRVQEFERRQRLGAGSR